MFVSQDTLAGLRSPHHAVARSSSQEPLHKGKIPAGQRNAGKDFEVHLVGTEQDRVLAKDLLNRMYDWRGYGADHDISNFDNSKTFAVTMDGEIVCTLTLTVDSDGGLAADKTFHDVLGKARELPGSSICELTKFASSPSEDSRFLLASLFHTIFIFGTEKYNCTDLFIEVNPRHVRFYEAMLGFEKVGELRTNEGVDAPSQLMRLKVVNIAHSIKHYGGRDDRAALRSLYPCFLSQHDERAVRATVQRRFGAVSELIPENDLTAPCSYTLH